MAIMTLSCSQGNANNKNMTNENNKNIKQTTADKNKQKDTRKPLPKANIIGKRLEIFNMDLNVMYKKNKKK